MSDDLDQKESTPNKPQNLYDILGVGRKATPDELKEAFRKIARECHPDLHKGDPIAEEKFKAVGEAYTVLSVQDKRNQYDRLGHSGYYQQNQGWNPIPEESKPGQKSRSGKSNRESSRTHPTTFNWQDISNLYESIFGSDFFGTKAAHDDYETKRNQEAAAKKEKYQNLGQKKAGEQANIFFTPSIREETLELLNQLLETENLYRNITPREARQNLLRRIDDATWDVLSHHQIEMLQNKYPGTDQKEKIDQAIKLLTRLRGARAFMRGKIVADDIPVGLDNRAAYEAGFKQSWDSVAREHQDHIDKKQYWFIPLTKEETTLELEKAKQWIKSQGQERGKFIKQISESPQVAEDEKFIRHAIRKGWGWPNSLFISDTAVDSQYRSFMQYLGTDNESTSPIWVVKDAFTKNFFKDKSNKDKDFEAEWEKVLSRYKAEAEAYRIKNSLTQYQHMPPIDFPTKQKLIEDYEAADLLIDMPYMTIAEELYNEGLKKGFTGKN